MSSSFDPYRKWLGIPPKDQPPNHYRLLGIELFESDPDVISNAADARMAHIRTFQTGPYSEWSQKLLNEIAAAKVCLLNPEKKAEYDAQLRAQLAAQGAWTGSAGGPSGVTTPAIPVRVSPGSVQPSFPSAQPIPVGDSAPILPQPGPIQEGWQPETALLAPEGMPGGASQIGGGATARVLASRQKAWQGPAMLAVGAAAVLLLAVLVVWMMQGASEPTEVAWQVGGSLSSGPGDQGGEKPSLPGPGGGSSAGSSQGSPGRKTSKEKVSPPHPHLPSTPPGATRKTSPASVPEGAEKQKPTSGIPESSEKPPADISPGPPNPSEMPTKGSPTQKEGSGKEEVQPGSSSRPGPSEKPEESPEPEKPVQLPPKQPAPSEPEQTKAAEEIRSLLQEDFTAVAKGGSPKTLAEKLLQYGQQTPDQPAAQYMLFQMAAEWAAVAGDASLLQEALDGLTQRFQVERRPILVATLEKAASGMGDENLLHARMQLIQETVEELLAEEDYPAADRLAKAALAMSRKSKDPDFQPQVGTWAGKIERQAQQYAKVREELDKLAKNPSDPEANLAVGRWYAVQTGQWEKALPYLAKANQPDLAEAARLDLQGPQNAADQQKLGDLWWQLSEKASGEERQALQARAVYWYEQALPNLSGLSKTSVQRRIETYQSSATSKEAPRLTKGEYVLYFDGQNTYATVPNFLYDGSKPLTVEVILQPQSAKKDAAIIGNLTPMGGWALALAKNPNRTESDPYWIFFFFGRRLQSTYSEEPAQIGQRVMLAAVYDGEMIRIFINGQRQSPGSPILRHRPGTPTLLIGASASPTGVRTNFFHGTIEQVRISFVARYTSSFTPPQRLEKDKDTELLLHFDTGRGTSVPDLSGARRAARIVAGKWIPRDASNP